MGNMGIVNKLKEGLVIYKTQTGYGHIWKKYDTN